MRSKLFHVYMHQISTRSVDRSPDPSPLVVLRRSIGRCELYAKNRQGLDKATATAKNGASSSLQIIRAMWEFAAKATGAPMAAPFVVWLID